MYSHFITYYHIALKLQSDFKGMYVSKIFSTSKSELIIELRNGNTLKQVVLHWLQGEIITLWNLPLRNEGKRCITWFQLLENACLELVESTPWERSLTFKFTNKQELIIFGFGKFGKVIAKQKGGNIASFLKDDVFEIPVKKELTLPSLIENATDLPSMFLFLPTHFPKLFNQLILIKNIENQIQFLSANLSLFYSLNPIVLNNKIEFTLKQQPHFIADCCNWATNFQKELEKSKKSKIIAQQLTSLEQNLKQTLKQQNIFNTKLSYRKLGDLLMSNYTIVENQWLENKNTVYVVDFETSLPIEISVKKDVTLQENVNKFYKREKNRHLEAAEFEKKIRLLKSKILNIENTLESKLEVLNTKLVSQISNKQPTSLPYKIVNYKDVEIWVGKSALDNDKMLKLTRKTDTWMHARNHSGSHVVIRATKLQINTDILIFAGKLAVQNSKAKTQTLVPVIYTERKYVSKGKKLPPGAVHVIQENVIDIINE